LITEVARGYYCFRRDGSKTPNLTFIFKKVVEDCCRGWFYSRGLNGSVTISMGGYESLYVLRLLIDADDGIWKICRERSSGCLSFELGMGVLGVRLL